jgi:hypothetical protein
MNTCAPESNGGGATAGDANGDGWVDLFVTRMHDTDILFCNDGDGTFTDCTAGTGLGDAVRGSNGAAFADVDNDGDQDLYVLGIGDAAFYLFINDGTGKFTEEAAARGVAIDDHQSLARSGTSVAFGDYDRDGYLDMYTTEWRQAPMVPYATRSHSRLLRNRGRLFPGYFEDVTIAAEVVLEEGAAQNEGYSHGFSAAFSDLDGDGWPDLAVAADYTTSRLYWNDGDGTFTDGTVPSGVGTDANGMGSTFGDVDGDGDLDWFVTSILAPGYDGSGAGLGSGNRLYINEGNRSFSDGTDAYGVRNGDWGWGTAFFDYDLDADLDLVMTNGYIYSPSPFEFDRMRLWRNDGGGLMSEVGVAEGVDDTGQGRGLVTFDYDADGDLDIFVVNNESTPVLLRNDDASGNAWLEVVVHGQGNINRDGIGTYVRVTSVDGGDTQLRQIGTVSHYLGNSQRFAHFGLGNFAGPIHEVEIEWPNGAVETLSNVAVNQVISLPEPAPALGGLASTAGLLTLARWRRKA